MQKPGRNRKQGRGSRRKLVNWRPGFITTVLDEKIYLKAIWTFWNVWEQFI